MEILVFGTLWFWLTAAVAAILIIVFLELALTGRNSEYTDNGGGTWSTIVVIAFIMAYYFLGSKQDVIDIGNYIKDNPWKILGWMGMYLGVGLVWSLFKWYFFLVKRKERLLSYSTKKKLSKDDIPKAADNKSRIITWMTYWPFSAFWTMIDEPVKKFFRFVYSKTEKIFQKMSDLVYKDVIEKEEK